MPVVFDVAVNVRFVGARSGAAAGNTTVTNPDVAEPVDFSRVEEVIERAREAKIPLYMLGFGRVGQIVGVQANLRNPASTANPATPLANPMDLYAQAANHGGLWRAAYSPRSVLGIAALLGMFESRA